MPDVFAARVKKLTFYTFEVYHPAIGYLRFVRDQMQEKHLTLKNGSVVTFQPASFEVKLPNLNNGGSGVVEMTVQLGRVGTEVKSKLRAISAYNQSTPNVTTTDFVYRTFIDGVEDASIQLWVKNVTIDGDSVAFSASEDNPQAIDVSRRYLAQDFKGLRVIS